MRTDREFIRAEFVDGKGVDCVSLSKADFKYLYDMSELLINIQSDIQAIRGIIEARVKVKQNTNGGKV